MTRQEVLNELGTQYTAHDLEWNKEHITMFRSRVIGTKITFSDEELEDLTPERLFAALDGKYNL